MDKDLTLVLGGTGHYGREIVRGLVARGERVRVLTRDTDRAFRILGEGPQLVEGDVADPQSVRNVLEGAQRLVIAVSAFSPKQIRRVAAIERDAVIAALEEARKAGVKRVVFISVFDIKPDFAARNKVDSADTKLAVEGYLKGSDFNWTVLGAPPSMELFFRMLRKFKMTVPGGGPPALPTISPHDLGEIAAQAVIRDDLARRRIRVVGEVIGFKEAAKRLSLVYGWPIEYRKIPLFLPKVAWAVTGLVSPFSKKLRYVHGLLGFIKLLNEFPQDVAERARRDRTNLRKLFDFTPTTLEAEASRRSDLGSGLRK